MAKDPSHLSNVTERDLGIGKVLEDDVGIANVGAPGLDHLQGPAVADQQAHVLEARVQLAGGGEHARRDVDGSHEGGPLAQRPCDPAYPAADLDNLGAGVDADAKPREHGIQRLVATGPEALPVGLSVTLAIVDEEERVLGRPVIPELRHPAAAPPAHAHQRLTLAAAGTAARGLRPDRGGC